MRIGVGLGRDDGSWRVRVAEWADAKDAIALRERDECARVQDARAVVRELRRLAEVQTRDDERVGNYARVGSEEARHILPERYLVQAECSGESCGGEIGAAAAECDGRPIGRAPDETRHHRNRFRIEDREEQLARGACRGGEVGNRGTVAAIGVHEPGRIHHRGRHVAHAERVRHEQSR